MSDAPADDGRMRRGAALMASGTAVSRLLGLLRSMVLFAAIGATGQAADAFAVANKLPNVMYMLLVGGVLNAVLVPQVVRAYKSGAGQVYVDKLLTFGFVVLAGLTAVLTLAAPLLVRLYADAASPAQMDLAVTFAYWCVPQVFFYGVYALLGQVLNARSSFGPYMWAPVVNNVVSIVGFLVFIVAFGAVPESGYGTAQAWGTSQVVVLAGAATLGVMAQALVLFPALRAAGVRYRPRWGVRDAGLGQAGRVATWTLVGLAVGQLAYVVVSRVVSQAPGAADRATDVASNAAYDAAFLIFMLPHSLVTVSLATALFTRLAEQAHDGDSRAVRATLSYGMRVVGVFTVLAAAVLAVLAIPVTQLILPSATAQATDAVAQVVVAMVVGLPAFGAWSMCQRVYYAYEDTRSMVPVQVVMAIVVVLGALVGRVVLPATTWVVGVGVAMSVSYLVGSVVALRHLHQRLHGVDGGRVLRLHLRAVLAAVPATVVGLGLLLLLSWLLPAGFVTAAVKCLLVGLVMVLVYVKVLRALRVRELDDLLRPVVGRLAGVRPLRPLLRILTPAAPPAPEPEPDDAGAPARTPRRATSQPHYPLTPWAAWPDGGGGVPMVAEAPPGAAPLVPELPPAPRPPRTARSRPHYPPGHPLYRPSRPLSDWLGEQGDPGSFPGPDRGPAPGSGPGSGPGSDPQSGPWDDGRPSPGGPRTPGGPV
ncbi:murein biosynthesis integral membrane protein MurJ [Cellulomonas sp. PSBB021]|uniref:murein biosynthesis integral membrane protein MurJ n=1 Tax=Cellulomonas sp. PSBB021 TaxID=2003551 RepID=UPI001E4915D9|nr:murein biosynthesis integral membrane protein MurJ [Cellulomonas sp. PSBB021]